MADVRQNNKKSRPEVVSDAARELSDQFSDQEGSDPSGSAPDGPDYHGPHLVNGHSAEDSPAAGSESVPPSGSSAVSGPNALRVLSRTIETEIIPRLLLLHRNGEAHRICGASEGRGETPQRPRRPLADEIDDFARLVLAQDVPTLCTYVASVRNRGISLESVCLGLLAPTASRLGEWWEEDFCDFTQVTVGLWRLQQVLHALNPPFETDLAATTVQGRVLLTPVPGDNHTFGLIMVADFFRRAGWYVCDNAGPSTGELVTTVRDEFFDVVGVSVGCVERFEAVVAIIAALRRGSRNRRLRVMVGGAPFVGHPERAAEVGADATAVDAAQAPTEARALLERPGSASVR